MPNKRLSIWPSLRLALIELLMCLAALASRAVFLYVTPGIWLSVLTFITAAVFPLLLAGYGGHLAALALEKSPRQKHFAFAIVWGLAATGVVVSGISQIVSYHASVKQQAEDQKFREDVLTKLKTIAEEPDAEKRKEAVRKLGDTISVAPQLHLTVSPSAKADLPADQPSQKDELLARANLELENCKDFLGNLDRREHVWSGGATAEDKEKLGQFNKRERLEPSPNEPKGHADAVREHYKQQIGQEERIFSSREMQNWNGTYSQEFQPVYWEMVERVSNANDIDDPSFMEKPKDLGMLQYECSHLHELIDEYKRLPH